MQKTSQNKRSLGLPHGGFGSHASNSRVSDEVFTERLILELESEGTDFHTVFKNQQVTLNSQKDYLI